MTKIKKLRNNYKQMYLNSLEEIARVNKLLIEFKEASIAFEKKAEGLSENISLIRHISGSLDRQQKEEIYYLREKLNKKLK